AGIAGSIGPEAEPAVRSMMGELARRGPDAEGLERFDDAVLGHRRLSIFDLSDAGRQPMVTPDRSLAVVFNGAIYNFRALRTELAAEGFQFRSQTDTEVLLHGYRRWGIDGLVARLAGMFAFALWDAAERRLWLVRDRLGVKPLHYSVNGKWLAFASSARALRAAQLVEELSPAGLGEYLQHGYIRDASSIYHGAAKVPPATIVEWAGGQMRSRTYWSAAEIRHDGGGPTFAEAVEETERLFLRAVERRLDADVRVGSLLSGGVDSSLVCWAVKRLGADIVAHTVSTPGDPWDESEDARATAKQLGIRHEVTALSPEESPGIEDMAAAYGEPFATPSGLGMIQVSRVVRSSATVLLTGDGGDDVFLGYPEHRHYWIAQRLAPWMPSELWRSMGRAVPPWGALRRAGHLLDYASGGLGAIVEAGARLRFYQQHGLLGERLAHLEPRREPWSAESGRNALTDFLAYDLHHRFTGEYLTKVDGGSMYHGLECRSPFLDQDLWEFAGALPYPVRLGRGLKSVLRELARRHIGERVAGGPKRGFGVPAQRWLTGRWRAAFEELFADPLLEREGWIRAAPVREQLARASRNGSAPLPLWYLYVLEVWLRHERAAAR
ncbi:MAG: asparagine synthase (glutamine-hydrolyzing), partial [Bryobacteraceae bacterium]